MAAKVYRYRLSGVGASLEYGPGGALIKENGSGKLQVRDNGDTALANMQGADPVVDSDFATKSYVDGVAQGLSWKEPVRCATTANITIATDLNVGDIIDGVTLADGDRVLVKNQTVGTENGIYIAGATPARSSDMDTGDDASSDAMFVQEGTTQADVGFVQTADPGIVGTDALTFQQFASITAGVTSITSVGTGESLVEDGSAPIPEIRSLLDSSRINFTAATNTVTADIVALSITTGFLADDAVTEPKIAALSSEFTLRATFSSGTSSPIAMGTLPANAEVIETRISVTTLFNGTSSPTAEIGTSGDPDALMLTTENNLERTGLYAGDDANTALGGSAIQITYTAGGSTAGDAIAEVKYIVTA